MRRTRYGKDVDGSFFVMELIVTFEKPFVTGGNMGQGGGDRIRHILNSNYN